MINTRVLKVKTRVLIVNDNTAELDSLVNGLEIEGFHVVGTTSPTEALNTLATTHFHVVLIDLMITDMNGLQLARQIREDHPLVSTMLMSDYLLSPVQLAKADTGAIGFVPMPCRFEEIAAFIKEKTAKTKNKGETNRSIVPAHSPFDVLTVRYSY